MSSCNQWQRGDRPRKRGQNQDAHKNQPNQQNPTGKITRRGSDGGRQFSPSCAPIDASVLTYGVSLTSSFLNLANAADST